MTDERIYGEAEIAEILEEATKDRDPMGVAPSAAGGLTLHQREWARLVADLRETFDAQGKIESHDDLRSWSNPAKTTTRFRAW